MRRDMQLKDRIWLPDDVVRGHGRVELFDARGKKVEDVPFENFIAIPQLTHNKWRVRSDYRVSAYNSVDPEPAYPFTHFITTNTTTAVSPSTETSVTSPVVAWSNKAVYAGSSTQQGTPNAAQCIASPTMSRWVFDWPTNSGNGTFRSLSWCRMNESLLAQTSDVLDYFTGVTTYPSNASSPGQFYTYDTNDGYVYMSGFDGNGYVQRTAWSGYNGNFGTTARFRTGTINYGLTACNGRLYVANALSSTNLLQWWPDTTNVGNTLVSPSGSYACPAIGGTQCAMTSDDTYLYLYNWSSTGAGVVTVLQQDGAVVNSFVPSAPSSVTIGSIAYRASDAKLIVGQTFGGNNPAYFQEFGTGSDLGTRYRTWASVPGAYSYIQSLFYVGSELYGFYPGGGANYAGYHLSLAGGLGARTLLPASVTKTSLQTMKITYQFDYT